MPNSRLTQRRVDALKPCRKTLDVRDAAIRGFGVRILPSGRKTYFLHSQVNGKRIWQSIGDAYAMTLECAREQATSLLAARSRSDEALPDDGQAILFEDVADEVFRRYRRHWKPRTLEVNLGYYRKQILPWFRGRAIGDITRRDVRRWFGSLHATPVAADRSAPVLSVIFRQGRGLRLPPRGLQSLYRHQALSAAQSREVPQQRRDPAFEPRSRQEVAQQSLLTAIVRLLLLTGCRKSEVLDLQWSDHREGRLYLRDSKTGPRTVWLSSPARRILDGLPRTGHWMFPSRRGEHRMSKNTLDRFWFDVRTEASITDVRLHDLRHSYASVALAHGETILTIGRLLGHNDPATTLKYTHLADASVHEAAEALVPVLSGRAGA